MLQLLALALLPLLVLADHSLRVFHRVYHPSLPDSPFVQRASLSVSGIGPGAHARLLPSQSLPADLSRLALATENIPGALYQVALEPRPDADPSLWHISAVKACHLSKSTHEHIVVHVTHDGTPFALDYFLSPTPHDGACPKMRRSKPAPIDSTARSSPPEAPAFAFLANSTLSLAAPRLPPLPQLRVPPPLSPEGKPVEPLPEKTLFQKYWLYGVVILLFLLMAPGAEEEGGRAGGSRR
ncbi:hypothetical protein SCP_0207360 [Sparassis crispa]|uniref:ER membrane protein complex subunit 10 n=1 Tax=Sparassis crispa TaxID=139825 RepID=A0A401GBH0_9APHY|nr:hypothetical protein SCP_0207360 [Sparassis crispa]GBE79536.1 hypothetical protein SCP_0207360 [Sparassis crispa]